jgi:hypothetical protein
MLEPHRWASATARAVLHNPNWDESEAAVGTTTETEVCLSTSALYQHA